MKRRAIRTTGLRAFVLMAAIGTAASGCISYEEQTMSYEHDVAADRLLVYTTYNGIYGEDSADALTNAEADQLLSTTSGERIYFFDNWTRVIDLGELREQLAAPPACAVSDVEQASIDSVRKMWAALVANVTIASGPFYLDSRGRLSAAQRMTVVNLRSTVAAVNAALRLYAEGMAREEPAWSARAATIPEWLSFTGNQFTLRHPRDEERADPFRLSDGAPDGQEIVTQVFGRPGDARTTIRMTVGGSYIPNALKFIRTHAGLTADFDPAADAERFFGQERPVTGSASRSRRRR